MATATVALVDSSYNSGSGTRFSVTFSESVSGLVASDFQLNGYSVNLNYTYASGNTYNFNFSHGAGNGQAGYIRLLLPRTAINPNLDSDLDWTFYWGTDGVLHSGATDSVRASRIRSAITNIRWIASNGGAGSNQQIEIQLDRSVNYFTGSDLTLTGDITSISSFNFYIDQTRYRGNVTLPSDLSGGGSFRIQIDDLELFYPGLSESVDWTLSWDASGNLSARRTADLPIEISASLNIDYVASGEEIFLTLRYSKDGLPVNINDISLVDGMTIQASGSPNNRTWIYRLTAPATGKGIGVISIAEDVIQPGNNAVTIQFTYIDSITAELSLSAAGIENGGTVIAQLDFDYDVPNFSENFLSLNNPNATLGTAQALDDDNRCWVVPVTVPQAGEGDLEISLPEDAIGFTQEAVELPVRFAPQRAPSIMLNIRQQDNLRLLPVIGEDFRHDISITGNNIRSVDVQGLLRPFYHRWNPNAGNGSGTLSIRGNPEDFYEIDNIRVSATDQTGTATANMSLEVVQFLPVFRSPDKLQFAKGYTNRVIIPVDNYPQDGTVEGTWIGLNHEIEPAQGVVISGDVPNENFGVNSGNFRVTVNNRTNVDVSDTVPWEIVTPVAPVWQSIKSTPYSPNVIQLSINQNRYADRLVFERGENFSINLLQFLNAVPSGTIIPVTGFPISNRHGNIVFNEETFVLSGNYSSSVVLSFSSSNVVGTGGTVSLTILTVPVSPHVNAIPTPAVKTNFRNGRTGPVTITSFGPQIIGGRPGGTPVYQYRISNSNDFLLNNFFENIGIFPARDTNIYNFIGLPVELYNPDTRSTTDNSILSFFHFRDPRYDRYQINRANLTRTRYDNLKGDYDVQLTMTNPKGTATTPAFTMRFE